MGAARVALAVVVDPGALVVSLAARPVVIVSYRVRWGGRARGAS